MHRPSDKGILDDMNLYEIAPATTTFLAEHGHRFADHDGGWSPWFLVARLVFFILVVGAVWLIVRTWRGNQGLRTLRDAYARGEVNEAEYRERLAVLKETRR
jgi:putative membrane protein